MPAQYRPIVSLVSNETNDLHTYPPSFPERHTSGHLSGQELSGQHLQYERAIVENKTNTIGDISALFTVGKMAKCSIIYIPRAIATREDMDTHVGRTKVAMYAKGKGAKRGDVVRLESVPEYRNDGVYIYNGRTVVNLYYDIDDYGSVPPEFTPIEEELPIDYWSECIDHNSIVWVRTDTIRNGLLDMSSDRLTFSHKGIVYTIVCDDADVLRDLVSSTTTVHDFEVGDDSTTLVYCSTSD